VLPPRPIQWDRRSCLSAILVAVLALVYGCGSPGRPNASGDPPAAKTIYVANGCNGTVTAYPVGSNGNIAPIVPNPALCQSNSIAVDRNSGDIYVANFGAGTVNVFGKGSKGSVAPERILAPPAQGSIAVGADGRLYLRTYNSILIYAPGASGADKPVSIINGSNTGLTDWGGIAVDGDGNIAADSKGAVLIFAPNSSGDVAPNATVPVPQTNATVGGCAFDKTGNLYISYNLSYFGTYIPPEVAVYSKDQGGYTQSSLFVDPTAFEFGYVAVDSQGRIYVGRPSFGIAIYAPGSSGLTTPTATLTGVGGPFVLDDLGQIFLAEGSSVAVFPPGSEGSASPESVIAAQGTGLSGPAGMAVFHDGSIYLSGFLVDRAGPLSVIRRFAAGAIDQGTPISTVSDGLMPEDLSSLALDGAGNQYVLSSEAHGVLEFAAGSNGIPTFPIATIAGADTGLDGDLRGPSGVAIDPHGYVCVTYIDYSGSPSPTGGILKFPPGSNGNQTPAASIAGPHTALSSPLAIAIDASGKLYVVDNGRILMFAPNAEGDASPSAIISGPHTQLGHAYAFALDHSADIFVLTGSADDSMPLPSSTPPAILEFAAGSVGDASPITVISGPATEMLLPTSIAISP